MPDQLVETAEDVSEIAFGFMASKALFAGLHVDVFTPLAEEPMTAQELSRETDVPVNRITTLMTALTGVGLVERDGERYANSPGAQAFLARGAKHEFGDYLRYQIDKQLYPFLDQLNQVMDGSLEPEAIDSYQHWMADPEQAALYSEAQHAGSLGPGKTLARLVDLSGADSLLDVAGGTGAMTIRLLQAYPGLSSTIIDFPNVSEIGWRFVTEAGLIDRVRYIPGNALEVAWPREQDAVLMSYLFSGVPEDALPVLTDNSWNSLAPGGHIMIHDFMVEDDRQGPHLAALWQLQHMAFTPDAHSVTPGWLRRQLAEIGFIDIQEEEMVPGLTRLLRARKPA